MENRLPQLPTQSEEASAVDVQGEHKQCSQWRVQQKKNQIKCRPAVVFPSEEKPGTYFHKLPITYPASHFFFAFVLHMPYLFSWHIESTVDPFHPAASIPHRVIVNSQAVNSLSPKREAWTILPEASTPCNTPKYRIYQCSHPTGPYLLRSSAEPGS